jgi:hypothetical protein
MATQIINNGASLKIKTDAQVRNIMKHQIVEIGIVKNNLLKIDIGKGALYNIFISFPDVVSPVATDIESLKDMVNDMLAGTSGVGTATEARQIDEIDTLNKMNEGLIKIQTTVSSLDDKLFFEPMMVDESNPNIIYKGFSKPASNVDENVWAIQRISIEKEVCTYQWADGAKNFDKAWSKRNDYKYS